MFLHNHTLLVVTWYNICDAGEVRAGASQSDFIQPGSTAWQIMLMYQVTISCKGPIQNEMFHIFRKPCWRATHEGRMILPYQPTGEEHLMAKNMAKYFRVKFARNPRPPDLDMLRNVSFKVFKVENVPPFRNDPDQKTELKARAVETDDLFGGNFAHRGLGYRWGKGGSGKEDGPFWAVP